MWSIRDCSGEFCGFKKDLPKLISTSLEKLLYQLPVARRYTCALFLLSTAPLPLFISCPAAPGIWYSGMLPTIEIPLSWSPFFLERKMLHRIPKIHIPGRLLQSEVIIFNISPYVGWKDIRKAHSVATQGNLMSSSIHWEGFACSYQWCSWRCPVSNISARRDCDHHCLSVHANHYLDFGLRVLVSPQVNFANALLKAR